MAMLSKSKLKRKISGHVSKTKTLNGSVGRDARGVANVSPSWVPIDLDELVLRY